MPDSTPPEDAPNPTPPERATITVPAGGLDFVTPEGRVLASLGVTAQGATVFTLHGPSERAPLALIADQDGGGLLLNSATSAASLLLNAAGGNAAVRLNDADGKPALAPVSAPQERAKVAIHGPNGLPVAVMMESECGGYFGTSAPNGGGNARLYSTKQGGEVQVVNRENRLVAALGVQDGDGCLGILDRGGVRTFLVPIGKLADATAAPPTKPDDSATAADDPPSGV